MDHKVTNLIDSEGKPEKSPPKPDAGLPERISLEPTLPRLSYVSSLPGGRMFKFSLMPLVFCFLCFCKPSFGAEQTPLSELDVTLETVFVSGQKQDIFQINVHIPDKQTLGDYLSTYVPLKTDGFLSSSTNISAVMVATDGSITPCNVGSQIDNPNLILLEANLSKGCRRSTAGGLEYLIRVELQNSGLTPSSPQSKVSFASGGWVMIDNIQIEGQRDLGNDGLIDYSTEGSGHIGSGSNHSVGGGSEGSAYGAGEGSVLNQSTEDDRISVGPNPFSTQFTVLSHSSELASVQVLDMSGKLVAVYPSQGLKRITISTEQYSTGMYIVRSFREDGSFETSKLIK